MLYRLPATRRTHQWSIFPFAVIVPENTLIRVARQKSFINFKLYKNNGEFLNSEIDVIA
jgi:hypothetical protein